MDIQSQLTLNPQIQLIIPILLILVPMLRSSPKVPNWLIQWIILALALGVSFLQSGFNAHALYNGFLASMAVTYTTRAFVNIREEKTFALLKDQCRLYEEIINAHPTQDVNTADPK
ncbi:MAG: hypothetical protein ACRCST_14310 [Turicibacter sp.]